MLLGLLTFLTAAGTAVGSDWRELSRSDAAVLAWDRSTARRSGTDVSGSALVVPRSQPFGPTLPVYVIMDLRVDCDARAAKVVGSQTYAGAVAMGKRKPAEDRSSPVSRDVAARICTPDATDTPGAADAHGFARGAWPTR